MRQGGFPILKMSPRTDPVSGFSAAVTETAVVEQKNRQTGLSKTLGKGLKSECSFRSKAMRHYDDRRSCQSSWEVQPCSAPRTTRHKINIAANPLSRSHAQIPVRDWDYDLSVPLAQGPRCLPPAQRRSIAQSFSLRPRVTDGDFLMLTLLAGILRFYPRSSAVAKHPPNLFAVQS